MQLHKEDLNADYNGTQEAFEGYRRQGCGHHVKP